MSIRTCVVACGMILGALSGMWNPASAESEMEKKIVAFAQGRVGTRVDPGECTDLVKAALASAGAKPMVNTRIKVLAGKPPVKEVDTYAWGKRVVTLGKRKPGEPLRVPAHPGCVIQFQNCVFKNGNSTSYLGIPNHTAIVKSCSGSKVTLLHQNVDGNSDKRDGSGNIISSKVREQTIDFAGIVSGSYQVYVPEPK